MLATVPGTTMPDIPSVGHELPATGTSANPPILTLGWIGSQHGYSGGFDRSSYHQDIAWITHSHTLGRKGRGERGGGRGGRGWRYLSFEADQAHFAIEGTEELSKQGLC